MMRVREALPEDDHQIVAFNIAMAQETEGKALDETTVWQGVKAVFKNSRNGTYYVIEYDGAIIGCLLVTYEWSDWRNGNFWWIQSVYVVPEFRQRGAFYALFTYVKECAQVAGAVGLRLYVEEENQRAQTVYQKLAMEFAGYYVYELMFDGKVVKSLSV